MKKSGSLTELFNQATRPRGSLTTLEATRIENESAPTTTKLHHDGKLSSTEPDPPPTTTPSKT